MKINFEVDVNDQHEVARAINLLIAIEDELNDERYETIAMSVKQYNDNLRNGAFLLQ
ncbi:hypothetical protein [Serratia marcescens]|uniref:hypothetical protein n=1 Tax=Serratia marcescens TaxID=615 RepID=UPI001F153CDA|nr:hypothetical protein [Serratia marcescens]MDP8728345.1 hypothetical protein [Serratia marcescens]